VTINITILCYYAEYQILFTIMLNAVMLSVIMLNVVAPKCPTLLTNHLEYNYAISRKGRPSLRTLGGIVE